MTSDGHQLGKFSWDYDAHPEEILALHEKAKANQWNASVDIDWGRPVDVDLMARSYTSAKNPLGAALRSLADVEGSPLASFGEREWHEFGLQTLAYSLAQTLHGEQGALLCASQLVSRAPELGTKMCAASQVIDEARHVEVFSRYLKRTVGSIYDPNRALESLLVNILTDERWDLIYLGMQVIVEGVALASFAMLRVSSQDPLLRQILRYVMADEARHVAFGVLALESFYSQLTEPEVRDRQEFALEACIALRERNFQRAVLERIGVSEAEIRSFMHSSLAVTDRFQRVLFSRIVPVLRRLGLVSEARPWLRTELERLGISPLLGTDPSTNRLT